MLVDSSALIAYFNKNDAHNREAKRFMRQIKENRETLDILDTVYEEVLAVLRKRHGKSVAIKAVKMMVSSAAVNLICIGKDILTESSNMFVEKEGKYSYVDCSLVVWAEVNKINTIVAIDRHFSELGLVVIP